VYYNFFPNLDDTSDNLVASEIETYFCLLVSFTLHPTLLSWKKPPADTELAAKWASKEYE
jgi:hypothetical protein